jgi:hypothetical protein
MQGEAERGETPVPDLRNLDLSYEIGATSYWRTASSRTITPTASAISKSWPNGNDYAPVVRDSRLWSGLPEAQAASGG